MAAQADALGLWAAENLVPEGPLPSMRVGDQPYGLLPATSLRRWRAAAGDPAIEARLVPLVRELVDHWAAAAERQAAQRPADALRRLVRNPTRDAVRVAVDGADDARRRRCRSASTSRCRRATSTRGGRDQAAETPRLDPAAAPTRQLVSVGWGQDVELPLVEPDDLPAGTRPRARAGAPRRRAA